MTLIAGFRSHGVPILLGDFVISSQGHRNGLRKKICRLNGQCVVAWTGHMLVANKVIGELNNFLSARETTEENLKSHLTSYSEADFGALEIHLIGWIVISGQPQCFFWDSSRPDALHFHEPMYAGSGANTIQSITGTGFSGTADLKFRHVLDRVANVLYATNILISRETLLPDTGRVDFGHMYEVLYFDDGAFRYLSNIVYLMMTFHLDQYDVVQSFELTGPIYKYQAVDEYSITEIFDTKRKHSDISLITPPGLRDRDWEEKKLQDLRKEKLVFDPKFYCVFVRFVGPTETTPPVSTIVEASEINKHLIHLDETGSLTVKLPKEMIDLMLQTIRKDQMTGHFKS